MTNEEKYIRESEQLRVLKNYIKLHKEGKPVTSIDVLNLVEALEKKEDKENE